MVINECKISRKTELEIQVFSEHNVQHRCDTYYILRARCFGH